MPGIYGNLVVKSKLPPRKGSSLEAVAPHPQKGAIKFFKILIDDCNGIQTHKHLVRKQTQNHLAKLA